MIVVVKIRNVGVYTFDKSARTNECVIWRTVVELARDAGVFIVLKLAKNTDKLPVTPIAEASAKQVLS